MITVLKQLRSKEDYIRLLARLYGFYGPMERSIRWYLAGEDLPFSIGARRSDDLRRDIAESGITVDLLEDDDALPVIDSFPRALGALYVLEGSTPGGPIIAEMVHRHLGLRGSLSFFNGYGAATQKRWQSFKDFLDRPRNRSRRQEILAAAQDTFITFKNWIEKNEFHPQL